MIEGRPSEEPQSGARNAEQVAILLPQQLAHVCVSAGAATESGTVVVQNGPLLVTMELMVRVQLERVEAIELLGMTLAHLNVAEARVEVSPRVPLLMAIRDKLAVALQEEA
jgi:hypothetical protein